jgi:hypothetical protein
MIILLLVLTLIALSIATAYFAYKSYKFGLVILRTQDAIEDALDVFDERYAKMTDIMQKPVFFDSIEIRQVIEDISVSRDAILFVASRLSSSQETSTDEDNNQKEKSRPSE